MTTRPELSDVERAEFAALWEANFRAVRDACARWMGGRDLGDEACARAALDALQKFARYRDTIRDPRGWLMAVGRSVCMDVHRELTRERRVIAGGDEGAMQLAFAPSTPERNFLYAERLERMSRALAALPPPLRRTLELRVVDERSYGEIAAQLGVTEPNVRKRVQQAREALRAYETGERPRRERPRRTSKQRVWSLTVPPVTNARGEVRDGAFFTEAGTHRRSAAWLERYTARHERGWKYHLDRARLLRDTGRTAAAIEAMREILARQPHNDLVAIELATLYAACGESALAAETCRRTAVGLRGPRAQRLAGLALRYGGEASEAAAALSACAATVNTVDVALDTAAAALEANDFERALHALDHATAVDPADVRVTIARGEMLQRAGDHERAFEVVTPFARQFVLAAEIAIISGVTARVALDRLQPLVDLLELYPHRAAAVDACAVFEAASGSPDAAEARLRAFESRHPAHVRDKFTRPAAQTSFRKHEGSGALPSSGPEPRPPSMESDTEGE